MAQKYWEHRYSANDFAEAMERTINRPTRVGHPFENPEHDDDVVSIFTRWDLILSTDTPVTEVGESLWAAHKLVSRRAYSILENLDSVLIFGKDTRPSFDLLKRIA